MPERIFINGRFLTQKLTGVQRYAYEMTKHLIAKGVQVQIIMPSKPIFKNYDTTGWPVIKFGFIGGHFWEQLLLPLYLMLEKRKSKNITLLNFCNTAPVFFGRKIISLHDISFVDNPQWFKKTFVFFYKRLIPQIIRRSIYVVTVSQFSKKRIEAVYPLARGKVKVIYGACASLSCKANDNEDIVLNKYQLEKDKFVLSVCSIEPRKNLGALIEAFSKFKNENIDLVLVGSKGAVFTKLVLNTEGDQRIKFTGYISDNELQILYRNALCFCYPSLYEGFGLPPLEAMANGCPVVVSKLPSLQEVCADTALYINPHNANTILSAIEELTNDTALHLKMREKSLARVNNFNFSKSADILIELLNKGKTFAI